MSYSSVVIADTPAAYFRLGEPSGTTLIDAMGGASGTIGSTVVLARPSLVPTDADTSESFPGTVSTLNSVCVPAARVAGIALPFSVEAWVNLDATLPAAHQPVFSFSDAAASASSAGVNRGGFVARRNAANNRLSWWDSVGSWLESGVTLAAGATYHVVVTHAGTNVNFYVNGVLANTLVRTGVFPTAMTFTEIGGSAYAAIDRLTGFLDEVAVYDYELLAAQISAHYAVGVAVASAPRQQTVPFMGGAGGGGKI